MSYTWSENMIEHFEKKMVNAVLIWAFMGKAFRPGVYADCK